MTPCVVCGSPEHRTGDHVWTEEDGAREVAALSRPATDPAGLDACPYCAAWHALDHNADNARFFSVADGPGPEERPDRRTPEQIEEDLDAMAPGNFV